MAQLFTALFSGSTSIFYGLLIFVLLYGTYVVLSFFYNIHKIGKIVDLLPGYKRHWLYGNLYLVSFYFIFNVHNQAQKGEIFTRVVGLQYYRIPAHIRRAVLYWCSHVAR